MTEPDKDTQGATDTATEYDGQSRASDRSGYARSAWALAAAVVCLVSIVGWSLFGSGGKTDPAPAGSPGNGVVREPGPATSRN
ncbi:hypothetical protein AAIH46_15050 [Rhizobium sp. 0TCS1.26]|uniref:hypothetical protein n=1 Tax=Rhizobium sp. 0TCS1.26 TaxID=3142623 RepID=UPI003D2855D0